MIWTDGSYCEIDYILYLQYYSFCIFSEIFDIKNEQELHWINL
jgi:hypothetical protein